MITLSILPPTYPHQPQRYPNRPATTDRAERHQQRGPRRVNDAAQDVAAELSVPRR